MPLVALLSKELREHGGAIALLFGGCLVLLTILLAQVTASEFSMGIMEVIRIALLTALPLFAFILGNRLVGHALRHPAQHLTGLTPPLTAPEADLDTAIATREIGLPHRR